MGSFVVIIKRGGSRGFPGGPVVKTFKLGGEGSVPGQGTKIPCLAAKIPIPRTEAIL